jgi:hypothetical protein
LRVIAHVAIAFKVHLGLEEPKKAKPVLNSERFLPVAYKKLIGQFRWGILVALTGEY